VAKRVAIVGGGLAGLSAAVRLKEKGCAVTLFEKRPFLGGRVSSFQDPKTGWEVDNGPHLLIGAYESTVQFLETIASISKIVFQPFLQTPLFDPRLGRATLRSFPSWGKLHLAMGLFRFKFLSLNDKFRIATAILKLQKMEESDDLDRQTVREWLIQNKQSVTAIKYFWEILCLATLNTSSESASFLQFFRVLKRAFLSGQKNSRLGFVITSFEKAFASPAKKYLEKRGGQILEYEPVLQIQIQQNQAKALRLKNGFFRDFDSLILAVPPDNFGKLLPKPIVSRILPKEISFSPIVSVHFYLKEPLFSEKFLAFVGGSSQWIFNMNAIRQQISWDGYLFSVSISGAEEEIGLSREELILRITGDFQKINPDFNTDTIQRVVIVKERGATALCTTGFEATRPCQRTPIGNVFLAGGWTRTGLPDTIESAVLSGKWAAEAIDCPGEASAS